MSWPGRGMRSARGRATFTVAACVVISLEWVASAGALGRRPVIVSMEWGFGGQITVGASVNPEGLQTTYEIAMECPTGCGLAPGSQHETGQLPGDEEQHEVALDVTGITPGIHWYWVHVSNTAGEAYWRTEIDVPAAPPGACPNGCSSNQPYKTELSQEAIELAANLAKEAPASQAAREAKSAEELAEQHAREAAAAARLAEEQATREHHEEERDEAVQPLQVCTVPRLPGDTLAAARRALTRAHCHLGHIYRPSHAHGRLRVARQSQPAGRTLLAGSLVSIRLHAK